MHVTVHSTDGSRLLRTRTKKELLVVKALNEFAHGTHSAVFFALSTGWVQLGCALKFTLFIMGALRAVRAVPAHSRTILCCMPQVQLAADCWTSFKCLTCAVCWCREAGQCQAADEPPGAGGQPHQPLPHQLPQRLLSSLHMAGKPGSRTGCFCTATGADCPLQELRGLQQSAA